MGYMGRVLLVALALTLVAAAPAAAQDSSGSVEEVDFLDMQCPQPYETSFCLGIGPGGAPPPTGSEQIPCPEDAPAGFTCWRFPDPDPDDLSFPEFGCQPEREFGPLKLTALAVKRPGGEWKNAMDDLCPQLQPQTVEGEEPGASSGYDLLLFTNSYGQDLKRDVPHGSEVSLEFESSGPLPALAIGTLRNIVVRYEGSKVAIQGETTRVRFANEYTTSDSGISKPKCDDSVDVLDSFAYVSVMLQGPGGFAGEAARDYQGAFWGTNAFSYSFPFVSWDGKSVEFSMSGCGDGDANTVDGFFQGFLPYDALDRMGIRRGLVEALPGPVEDELMEMSDNGEEAPAADFEEASPADLKLERAPGISVPLRAEERGMSFDYSLSFSSHNLRASADRKDARVARKCRSNGGKVRVKGKRRKVHVVCRRPR
jgi:hypothetical protein